MRDWRQRALQLDSQNSFPSANEERAKFERVLADSGYDVSPASLDGFLRRYHSAEAASVAPAATVAPIVRPAVAPVVPVPVVLAPPLEPASTTLKAVVPSWKPEPSPSAAPVSRAEPPTFDAHATDSHIEV